MKYILYNTLISILALLCVGFDASSQNISGETHVSVGQRATYSFTGGNTIGRSYQWSVMGGGTPIFCGLNCNSVDVDWTSDGTVKLVITEPGQSSETYTLNVFVCSGTNTPVLSDMGRCGPGDVILNVDNPSGTYEWYESAIGGDPISSGFGSPGVVYTLSGAGDHTLTLRSLSASRTLYVQSTGACGVSLRTAVTAHIRDIPSRPVTSAAENACYNGSVTITASGANENESYLWYFNDVLVSSNESYTTPALTASRTYEVEKVNAYNCAGGRESVTVNVYNQLEAGAINGNKTICFNSAVGTLSNALSPQGGSGFYVYQWQYSNNGTSNWLDINGATSLSHTPGNIVQTRHYRRQVTDDNGCGELYSNIVVVNVEDQVFGGVLSEGAESFGEGTGTLNLSEHSGTIKQWQYQVNGGAWQNISHTSASFSYNITTPQTRTYRVEIDNGTCAPVYSTQSTVTVYAIPTIELNGPRNIAPGNSTQLYTQSGYYDYQWFQDDVIIPGANGINLTVTQPGAYKLRVSGSAGGVTYTTLQEIIGEEVLEENINKITTIDFRKADVTQSTLLTELDYEDYQTSISYADGLGAPIQSVIVGGSPEGNDIVQPVAFDHFGRQARQYLPYTTTERIGHFRFDAIEEQSTFYQTAEKVAHDIYPYGDALYEDSPLNRVLKQGAPGAAWQIDGATVDFDYQVNSASDQVIVWKVDPQTDALNREGNYFPGELRKNITKDEQGNQIIEFVNKRDQTILKKVQVDELATVWASTYYVYDHFDNLRVVLPPEAVKNLGSSLSPVAPTPELLDNWAFTYKYDGRQRIIEKKVPGAETVYLVYDARNRLVLTQDGNQRVDNQWIYTKYDAFNRPIITGFYSHPFVTSREEIQHVVTVYSKNLPNDAEGWFEERISGELHGYSNRSFPINTTPSDVLTVNYYDHYDLPVEFDGQYDFVPESGNTNYFGDVKGQITATKTRVLDTEQFLKSVTYYDNRYRQIQVLAENIKGIIRATNQYDFVGNVVRNKTTHITVTPEHVPVWTNLTGVSLDGDRLVKNASNKWGNGGAASVNRLAANTNGWLEYVEEDGTVLNNRKIIGFSTTDINASYNTIGYGIQLASNGKVNIWRNGSVPFSKNGYAPGDIFRIERKDGLMLFFQNGGLLHQELCDQSEELIVDLSIYHRNAYFSNVRTSFDSPTSGSEDDDQLVIKRKFNYDHANRLLSTYHRVNDGPQIILAANEYNELGELVEKNLHAPLGTDQYAQSIDYRYNIRGWLTSINNAQLEVGTNNDDDDDYFGMELAYNDVLAGINSNAQFNGNISAVKWSSDVLGNQQSSYSYSYDALNRIKGAAYYHNPGFWERQASFEVSNINYDLNGNILSLIRNGKTGADIDILSYDYGAGNDKSNRLLSVTDASGDEEGFADVNGLEDDYTYDANGNMISDLNKDIVSITYNYLNLPTKVKKSDGGKIVYLYDARGIKLSQTVITQGLEVQTNTTDYIGETVRENDELVFVRHEEGRLVPNDVEGGFDYQYNLTDHLGNVRMTFTTNPKTLEFDATMESESAGEEDGLFSNTSETRVAFPSAAVSGDEVSRTNNQHPVGPAISLPVNPGDKINLSAYAYFEGGDGYSSTSSLASFVSALAGSFGGSSLGSEAQQLTYNAFDNALGIIGIQGTADDNIPAAFINYILFDDEMQYQNSGFKQISSAARFSKELVELDDILINQSGYIYCYVSTESNSINPVYWDDFNVTLTEHAVIQKDDYYPFGLTFNSYSKASVDNNFKFQGQEHEEELQWDQFRWRNHQPAIGRFFNIDPLAEDYYYNSPYAFSENKVVAHIELEGLESHSIKEQNVKSLSQSKEEKILNTFSPTKTPDNRLTIGLGLGARGSVAAINGNKLDVGFDLFHVLQDIDTDNNLGNTTRTYFGGALQLEVAGAIIGGEFYLFRADDNGEDFIGFKAGDISDGFSPISSDNFIDNDPANVVDTGLLFDVGGDTNINTLDFIDLIINSTENYINDVYQQFFLLNNSNED